MALHEEEERIASSGEVAALAERWDEMEAITAIADSLPHDPLPSFRERVMSTPPDSSASSAH